MTSDSAAPRRGPHRPPPKRKRGLRVAAAALALFATVAPARPQSTGSPAKTAPNVVIPDIVRRAVTEGCAPPTINASIDTVAFGHLAGWLDVRGRSVEAHHVRAMMQLETELFASMRNPVEQFIAAQVFAHERGGRWDAERNLSLAATLLGGTDNLIRYVAAARGVHLAIYESPSRSLFATATPPFDRWARDGEPEPGMTALRADINAITTRGAFQIPLTVGRYVLSGDGYARLFTADAQAIVSVNTDALAAVARARSEAVQALAQSDAPLRQRLVAKLSRPQDEVAQPTDEGDVALTFAAWLPSLCLAYQQVATPLWFSQRVVDELYIAPLKAKGNW